MSLNSVSLLRTYPQYSSALPRKLENRSYYTFGGKHLRNVGRGPRCPLGQVRRRVELSNVRLARQQLQIRASFPLKRHAVQRQLRREAQ